MISKTIERVLMTADTVGGVWTYALQLSRALAAKDIEVGLATMGRRLSAFQRSEIETIPTVALFESDYKLEWMQDPWNEVSAAGDWLLEICSGWNPDVVHLNSYTHGALPWRQPVITVGHSCVCSWWDGVHRTAIDSQWATYKERVREGLAASDLVIAPSKTMLKCLQRHYGPLPRSRVIYNARSPFAISAEKETFIMAAGRLWDPAKNIESLSEIAGQLDWPVLVAGDSGIEGAAPKECSNLKLLGALRTDEVRSLMSRAAIYAFPARYEPFGLSILEAALADCALVLGDIESLRELWDGAALFVEPEDTGGLRRTINELIASKSLRQHWAAKARERAAHYSLEGMTTGYLSAYMDTISAVQDTTTLRDEGIACRS